VRYTFALYAAVASSFVSSVLLLLHSLNLLVYPFNDFINGEASRRLAGWVFDKGMATYGHIFLRAREGGQ
jgi:hypothetical protein